jgi:hypothetical protein
VHECFPICLGGETRETENTAFIYIDEMGYPILCFKNVMSTLKRKISEVAVKEMSVPVTDAVRRNVIGGDIGCGNLSKTFNYREIG